MNVYCAGLIEYSEAYSLQMRLHGQRAGGEIPDTLLILEHPPTITVGRFGKLENVLVSQAQLVKEGVSLFFIDRGGDVTYHGPGQIVVYPIIDLRNRGRDLHQYVHDLEEVIIRTLNNFDIKSYRDENHAGVWVNDEEIAAIGISVKKWVSMHGLAININTDLNRFSLINPCGLTNIKATSISSILSQDIPKETVVERLLVHFSEVFNIHLELRTEYIR